MRGYGTLYQYLLVSFLYCSGSFSSAFAEILSADLRVITSSNPESNSLQSFIIINEGELIKEGIGKNTSQQLIGKQVPFVIEYTKPLQKTDRLKWKIKVRNKQHGTVELLSRFKGSGRIIDDHYQWVSEQLTKATTERHKLIFRPAPFEHIPRIYKKGKGPQGNRRKYGGGTPNIDEKRYNPQFIYDVTLIISQENNTQIEHKAILKMDRKDMIRQEYVNHYQIKRYGRGENGNIPIPKRSEISSLPPRPDDLEGNPLTESRYKLVINDGMLDLAKKISKSYKTKVSELKKSGQFLDLNKNPLAVPDAKLWISSGWRNPERNEWYSNAVNGVHQRGGAVDFVIMAPPNSTESAAAYWILWAALQENSNLINAYWQLETNGRPMTTRELQQDIDPKNGIPDAFDKADHLHANIHY